MLSFPGRSLTAVAGLCALSLMLALVAACGGAAETPAPAAGQTSSGQSSAAILSTFINFFYTG